MSVNLPLKAEALIEVLERTRPKSIIEFGSGHSTTQFAAYAAKHGDVDVATIDENAGYQREWLAKARKISDRVYGHCYPVVEAGPLAWYDGGPTTADLIFVDGPMASDARKNFPKLQRAEMDVPTLLLGGARPKTILVDGRIGTVNALLRSAGGSEYRFYPEFIYTALTGGWPTSWRRLSRFERLA